MNEQLHKEITELQSELSRLNTAVRHIEDASKLATKISTTGDKLEEKYKEQIKEIKGITTQSQKLATKAEALIKKIDSIDFPNRLEKLDNTVSSINTGLQNVQTKFENHGRDLKDGIRDIKESVGEKLKVNSNEIKAVKQWVYVAIAFSFVILILEALKSFSIF